MKPLTLLLFTSLLVCCSAEGQTDTTNKGFIAGPYSVYKSGDTIFYGGLLTGIGQSISTGAYKCDTSYAIMLLCDTVKQTGEGYNSLRTTIGGSVTTHGVRKNVIPWVYWAYGYVVQRYEYTIAPVEVIILNERKRRLKSSIIVWDYRIIDQRKQKAF